jgi:hypothetical protein
MTRIARPNLSQGSRVLIITGRKEFVTPLFLHPVKADGVIALQDKLAGDRLLAAADDLIEDRRLLDDKSYRAIKTRQTLCQPSREVLSYCSWRMLQEIG